MTDIIGVFSEGYGSGKDSVANVLSMDFGYRILGFSEILYTQLYYDLGNKRFDNVQLWTQYCHEHKYDKPDQEGHWVRKLMQGYGQIMRYKNPDYWVDEWVASINLLDKVVAPSVRYPNEAIRIREMGGRLVKVIRPGIVHDNDPSETSMSSYAPDYVILNDGTLTDLRTKVFEFMRITNKVWSKDNPSSVMERSPAS